MCLWRIWRRVSISIFLFSRGRISRYTTQLCRLLQWCNWSFPTTFLWLLAGHLLSLNMSEGTCSSIFASGLKTCIFDTREDSKFTWRVLDNFCYGTEFRSFCLKSCPLCCLMFFWGFSPFVILGLRVWRGRRRSVSDHCTCLLVLVSHDWNCMRNSLPLSSQLRLSILSDSWWLTLIPRHRSEPWSFEFSPSDQHEVLQTSSMVNNLSVHCFERFFGRTKPTTVWSWTESCNFDVYNPSRFTSEGMSVCW